MVCTRLDLDNHKVVAATADQVQLSSPRQETRADYLVASFSQQVGGGFFTCPPELYPSSAASRNGAHVVRWIGLGPRRRMAARCAGVA